MQQRGLDRLRIEPEVLDEQPRHGQRMGDVRLATGALLGAVRLDREQPRFADLGQVGLRIVRGELLLELALGRVQGTATEAERDCLGDSVARPGARGMIARWTQGLDRHLQLSVP